MTTRYGTAFAGSATDPLAKANGTSHNASLRAHKNAFNLATEGGDTGPYIIGRVGPGNVVDHIVFETSANLSAINFTVGTAAAPAKYGASVAGPNATNIIIRPPLAATLPAVSDVDEEIILTASANMPGAGFVRTNVVTSKR